MGEVFVLCLELEIHLNVMREFDEIIKSEVIRE